MGQRKIKAGRQSIQTSTTRFSARTSNPREAADFRAAASIVEAGMEQFLAERRNSSGPWSAEGRWAIYAAAVLALQLAELGDPEVMAEALRTFGDTLEQAGYERLKEALAS